MLRDFAANPEQELTHFEYFRLCASSHYLTCATPVPTDVDNQIRQNLWPSDLPLEDALRMADFILESHRWDFTCASTRWIAGLSGHLGEWFTLASGAYCALKRNKSPQAQSKREELFENIRDEVNHHSEIFGSLWRASDGVGLTESLGQYRPQLR